MGDVGDFEARRADLVDTFELVAGVIGVDRGLRGIAQLDGIKMAHLSPAPKYWRHSCFERVR